MIDMDEDDRYPLPAKEKIEVNIEDDESDEQPGKPIDPEFEKILDTLGEMKERIEEARKLPPEKQQEYWDRLHHEALCQWPRTPLASCKDPEGVNSAILEAFGSLIQFGYGDMQELCDYSVFKQALKELDVVDCESEFGRDEKETIPDVINRCFAMKMEDIVKERLRDDGASEDDLDETYLYYGERGDFYSPYNGEFRGPLAERAEKSFREE